MLWESITLLVKRPQPQPRQPQSTRTMAYRMPKDPFPVYRGVHTMGDGVGKGNWRHRTCPDSALTLYMCHLLHCLGGPCMVTPGLGAFFTFTLVVALRLSWSMPAIEWKREDVHSHIAAYREQHCLWKI